MGGQREQNLWGTLPGLALTTALGLVIVAVAFTGGRMSQGWSDPLFWIGLLLIFAPSAMRLLFARAMAPGERLGVLLILGLALYAVKILQYPLAFSYFDEFQHVLGVQSLLQSHHLFQPNPLNDVALDYPGLELATSAVARLSGLSVFAAGLLVIGVARILMVLALYLFFEHIGRSARLAALGVLVYLCNPHFLFFDAQFAYESLALPLAALALASVSLYPRLARTHGKRWLVVIVLLIATIVVTHHLTSYVLTIFLAGWAELTYLRTRTRHLYLAPLVGSLAGAVLSLAWLAYSAADTATYLLTDVGSTLGQFGQLVLGHGSVRQFFQDYAGFQMPLWERATTYASVAIILLGLALGTEQMWQRYRRHAAALPLLLAGLAYPLTQVFRLTQAGAEPADRATAFVFIGLGFVLATGIVGRSAIVTRHWSRALGLGGAILVLFVGGVIAGGGPTWNRTPGPYLVLSDARSISPQGVAAASWSAAHLSTNSRMATDRDDALLMASVGQQYPLIGRGSPVEVAPLFTALAIGPEQRVILAQGQIRYVVVDSRLSTGLPRIGYYFDPTEPLAFQYRAPLAPAALGKFSVDPHFNRIYDNGIITIYSVRGP